MRSMERKEFRIPCVLSGIGAGALRAPREHSSAEVPTLMSSNEISLRSSSRLSWRKLGLPVLAGAPPPKEPPTVHEDGSDAAERRRQRFGEYYCSNFIPWALRRSSTARRAAQQPPAAAAGAGGAATSNDF